MGSAHLGMARQPLRSFWLKFPEFFPPLRETWEVQVGVCPSMHEFKMERVIQKSQMLSMIPFCTIKCSCTPPSPKGLLAQPEAGYRGQFWDSGLQAETSHDSWLRSSSSPMRAPVSWVSSLSSSLLRMRGYCPKSIDSPFQPAHLLLLGLESGIEWKFQMSSQNFRMLFPHLQFLFLPSAPM